MKREKSWWLKNVLRSRETIAVLIVAFGLSIVTLVSYELLRAADNSGKDDFFMEFLKGVHVETVGLLFDAFLFGLLIYIIRRKDEAERIQTETIDRNMEILDDYRSWGSEEALYRITGALKRLTKYTTSIDLSGLHLKNAKLTDRGIHNISGSSFSLVGRETRLRTVSFENVACKSVIFSDYTPYSAAPLLASNSKAIRDPNRDPHSCDRVRLLTELLESGVPKDLLDKIESILKDNNALLSIPTIEYFERAIRSFSGKDSDKMPDDLEIVQRALNVLTRLSEPVCFEGFNLNFKNSDLEGAQFDGARLIWSSNSSPFTGARGRELSFKNATIINGDFLYFSGLDKLVLDGAWFYPEIPQVGASFGLIRHFETGVLTNQVSFNDAVDINEYLTIDET